MSEDTIGLGTIRRHGRRHTARIVSTALAGRSRCVPGTGTPMGEALPTVKMDAGCRSISQALGIDIAIDRLQRERDTTPQTGLDAAARRRNLARAFTLSDSRNLPAHIAIFDDVMTTGSTLGECARVLRKAGVERIDVWALARAPAQR